MSDQKMPLLLALGAVVVVVIYHLGMPHEYTRIGLFAGLGIGGVFGSTVPLEDTFQQRLRRAVRSSVAFAATTGLGYGVYQGELSGVSWGFGGLVGCVCGGLIGQLGRSLFVRESEQ